MNQWWNILQQLLYTLVQHTFTCPLQADGQQVQNQLIIDPSQETDW